MEHRIDLTCPQCGGNMEHNEEKHMLACPYCGHTEILEENNADSLAQKAYARQAGILQANEEAEQRKKTKKTRRKLLIILIVILVIGGIAGIAQLMPKTDPFECITLSFSGIDGDGEAEIVYLTDTDSDVDPRLITYHLSPERYLSEGDTVTVTAESSDYSLSPTKKLYTVEGLDLYLTDLNSLSDEAMAMIHNSSESMAKKAVTGAYGDPATIAPYITYFVTDGKKDNAIYDIYKVTFNEKDGTVCERYTGVYFTNVLVRDTEEPTMRYDNSMYFGDIIEAYDNSYGGYITAYFSVKDARSDILSHQDKDVTLQERAAQ